MNTADELDGLIRSTLGEPLRKCQPSARVWDRIVVQIKRDEAAARASRLSEIECRQARFDSNPRDLPGMWGSGILSYWMRWTQLVHQVR